MRYLKPEDVLVIHAYIIDQTTGSHGLRDLGLLISACERPQASFSGKPMYRGVFAQAAAVFHSLAMNHAFVDGNKRTAVATTIRFLEINGYEFIAPNPEVEDFVVKAVAKKYPISDITAWFRAHAKKRVNRRK